MVRLIEIVWLPLLLSLPGGAVAAQRVENGDVSAAVQLALESELRAAYPLIAAWSITPVAQQEDENVQNATLDIKVVRLGARSAVNISSRRENATRYAKTLWFDVAGMQTVAVAVRDLPPKQSLIASDVTFEERDVMAKGCAAVSSIEQLRHMRMKRAVRAATIICRNALENGPAVAQGERVTVHYQSPRVSITTNGIAQQDGEVGQPLRVTNRSSNDSFLAVVTADHEVAVYE